MDQYFLLALLVLWMFAIAFVLPYFQRRRQRQMITQLDHGDSVIVLNGILGKVSRIDGNVIEVEIAPKVRIRCMPNIVSRSR